MKKVMTMALMALFTLSVSAQTPVKRCDKKQCTECPYQKDCKKDCKNDQGKCKDCPAKNKDCKKQDCKKQDCKKQDCKKQDCKKQDCKKQDCKKQCGTPCKKQCGKK